MKCRNQGGSHKHLPSGLGGAPWVWLAVFLLLSALWLGSAFNVPAYENDNNQRTMKDGPHRVINGLALKRLMTTKEAPAAFKRYEFEKLPVLRGEGVVSPGLLPYDLSYRLGPREGSFIWWIIEGGYTADEPELYASFRHFYDPKAISGKTYLTDHLESIDWLYQILSTRMNKKVLGLTFYPQVDAREWAISGPQNEGFGRNEYAWDRGLEAMRDAFAAVDPVEKSHLFVRAWRSLGETMHLIADMTSPAHVRNDSHPGLPLGAFGFGETDPNVGYLKADAYESYTSHRLVMQYGGGAVDSELQRQIVPTRNPEELFDVIATYTQENFFSVDTIFGVDRLGRGVTSANGQRDFPSPKLRAADFRADSGNYVKTVNGRPVCMAHESWLLSTGWGSPKHAAQMTYPCVQDQVSVLVPVAIQGAMKLADWFIPKIEVNLESFDPDKKILKGRVNHRNADSAYPTPLQFNASQPPAFYLYMNDGLQNWDKIKLQSVNGEITADLSKLDVPEKARLALVLDIGGMRVRSEELKLGEESVVGLLQKATRVEFGLWGTFQSSAWGAKERSEEYALNLQDRDIQQWTWNGTSFEIVWKSTHERYGGIYTNVTRTIRLSGTVSGDGRTLSSCTLKVDTEFPDGPTGLQATLSGLAATIQMPELGRPFFVCNYQGEGPGAATCVIRSRSGSFQNENTLTGKSAAPARVKVSFYK